MVFPQLPDINVIFGYYKIKYIFEKCSDLGFYEN